MPELFTPGLLHLIVLHRGRLWELKPREAKPRIRGTTVAVPRSAPHAVLPGRLSAHPCMEAGAWGAGAGGWVGQGPRGSLRPSVAARRFGPSVALVCLSLCCFRGENVWGFGAVWPSTETQSPSWWPLPALEGPSHMGTGAWDPLRLALGVPGAPLMPLQEACPPRSGWWLELGQHRGLRPRPSWLSLVRPPPCTLVVLSHGWASVLTAAGSSSPPSGQTGPHLPLRWGHESLTLLLNPVGEISFPSHGTAWGHCHGHSASPWK